MKLMSRLGLFGLIAGLCSVSVSAQDAPGTLIEDGVTKDQRVINARSDSSLAWNDYNGPLKFAVEPSP